MEESLVADSVALLSYVLAFLIMYGWNLVLEGDCFNINDHLILPRFKVTDVFTSRSF